MPLRVAILWLVVMALAMYSWRDWFVSLCGWLVLLAFIEHPDMPRKIMGIQGLNPLNIVLVCVLLAWMTERRSETLKWEMPGSIKVLGIAYAGVFLIAITRLLLDREAMAADYTLTHLISERLINTIKWVLPGMLLYQGCRTPRRLRQAVVAICAFYILVALQVVIYMPMRELWSQGQLEARMRLPYEMGLPPAVIGKLCAGGAWMLLAAALLTGRKLYGWLAFSGFVLLSIALGLSGSRSAYLAWVVTGLVMCLLRWRKGLLAAPVIVLVLFFALHGAAGRVSSGFGERDFAGRPRSNLYVITAGRNLFWPYVVEKIGEAPITGFGRDAVRRTGLSRKLQHRFGRGEAVGHAHNAYLNLMLESGVIGLAIIVAFFAILLRLSAGMFRLDDPSCAATGGIALAVLLGHLVAGVGSQHFWPQEGDVAMWCAIGLLLRGWAERERVLHLSLSRHRNARAVSVKPAKQRRALNPGRVAAES